MSGGTDVRIPLILQQIAARLHEIFDGLVDLSDVAKKSDPEKERFFLTRAYAALYFLDEIGLDPKEAANCITDGGADDGIDAVYIDPNKLKIYFLQSKWRDSLAKGVELGDFTRIRDGVLRILSGIWDDTNANIHQFRQQIETQLQNINTEIVIGLVHTSEQDLSNHIVSAVNSFLNEQNKYGDLVRFEQFTVKEAARVARSQTRPENINLTVMLKNWGLRPEPYKAVYGEVSGADVVAWYQSHGNKLFAENLRFGIEKSEVNDGIIATAQNDPQNFWYFNNGITAICDAVDKQPIGGNDTKSGVFDIKKISVINGAQTINSLSKARANGSDLENVSVHLRIISLDNTPDGFSSSVTSANNTQNDLNPVDFVAADANQDRIRREALQIPATYAFRRGEPDPERDAGFTIRQATIAAACASGDLRLAVQAKRYISGLWENVRKEPYTRLFNEGTSANYLWRLVQVMHAVDEELVELGYNLSGRAKHVTVHGNRFVLFYVFRTVIIRGDEGWDEMQANCGLAKRIVDEVVEKLIRVIEERFADAYVGNVFKNRERQEELLGAL